MKVTRRNFIKGSMIFGGTLFLQQNPWDGVKRVAASDVPGYATLEKTGKLGQRVEQAYAVLESCRLCPRECGVNRTNGETGFCRAPGKVMVYAAQPHFGEEKSLVGKGGSGTIFFSNCNLRCVFCQNWPIAHKGHGEILKDEALADMMINLQKIGCHNINLVTPTHVTPNIINAVKIAFLKGLRLPIVYNTSGYERVEILKILDDILCHVLYF